MLRRAADIGLVGFDKLAFATYLVGKVQFAPVETDDIGWGQRQIAAKKATGSE